MAVSPRLAWLNRIRASADIVEAKFGTHVDLLPWESNRQARFSAVGPDTTRTPQMNVRVLYKEMDADEAQKIASLNSNMPSSQVYIKLRQELVDACKLGQGDRVRLLDYNNEMLKVSFVSQSAYNRPRVYLVRDTDPE